jgi:hypothetical protein
MHNINPLKTQLNPICHLLALLGAHHILHVSRIRVKRHKLTLSSSDVPVFFTSPQLPINRNQSVHGKSDAVSVRRHAQTSVLSVRSSVRLHFTFPKINYQYPR